MKPILRTPYAPPGEYKNEFGQVIQIEWERYKPPKKTAHTEIGELVQIGCTVIGIMALVLTFIVGLTNIVMFFIPPPGAGV